jgi:tRNA(Ile)-lysidine synthase
VSAAEAALPVSAADAAHLFAPLRHAKGLVLAVSGGPDSTALLYLASRWRQALDDGPSLLAVTVDHGLRPEASAEADAVMRIAQQCDVAHQTMRWTAPKPATGLQQAARAARYRLLAEAAVAVGADHVLTGHTRDDQAETVLIRMSRGSGIAGLGGMRRMSPLPAAKTAHLVLARPFLDLPKARLVATAAEAGLPFADDPSNRDPTFTRARIRASMLVLAREGLTAARLAQLARRLRRAETVLEAATAAAWADIAHDGTEEISFDRGFAALPVEVQLRLLGRAVARLGNEGPVQLGKLEAAQAALADPGEATRARRTLAGAVITRTGERITIARAPARQRPPPPPAPLNQGESLPPQSDQAAVK